MALNTLAIDIGKYSFHLFGIDDDGVIVSRKVSRLKLVATVDRLDPKIIAMEACGSAHHWGRMFQEAGRMVRLINPYFVRPFVRGSKNDATDAQAIFEAAGRPTMHFVPVKSLECQDAVAPSHPRPLGPQPHLVRWRRTVATQRKISKLLSKSLSANWKGVSSRSIRSRFSGRSL